jgi:hypothetical protein
MNGAVWSESPSVTSARPILKRREIVNFIITVSFVSATPNNRLFGASRVNYFALLSFLIKLGPFLLRLIVSSFLVRCNLPAIDPPPTRVGFSCPFLA